MPGRLSRLRESVAGRVRPLRRAADFFRREYGLAQSFPRGHYHSPLPDIARGADLVERALAQDASKGLPGIRLDAAAQRRLLAEMADLAAEFDWPENPTAERRYSTGQDWFGAADGFVLYAMLRLFGPKQVVEIGCGYSSALMLDARDLKLKTELALTFIDPSMERLGALLRPADSAAVTLHATCVEDAPRETFAGLRHGDILFVDSSHVSKVGSELHTILFEIVPGLAPGVIVHFHDVFWPFEYPAEWIRAGVSWNESYLIRAFLMFNPRFEILFWGPYAAAVAPELAERLGKIRLQDGASLWLRRAA